jgi:copper chaperone CopZ
MLKKILKSLSVVSLIGLPTVGAAGCQSTATVDDDSTSLSSVDDPAFVGDRTAELVVLGMPCPFCVQNVESQLTRVVGVERVAVELATGRVRVLLSEEGAALEDDLVSAVKASGFTLDQIEMPR